MGDTGIVRRIDALGRIVIPVELRRTLGINVHDPLSMRLDGATIVVERYRESCAICGAEGEMVSIKDRAVCRDCVATVKRA